MKNELWAKIFFHCFLNFCMLSKIKLDIHCVQASKLSSQNFVLPPSSFVQFSLKKLEKICVKTHKIDNAIDPIWDEHLSLYASDLTDTLIVHLRNGDFPFEQLMDPLEFPLSSISPEMPINFDNDIKLDGKDAGHLEFHVYCVSEELSKQNNLASFSINISLKEIDNILSAYKSDDFVFLTSNQKTVTCNKIIADIISPKIANIHKCDPTVDFFDLSFADYRLLEKLIRNKNNEYCVFHNNSIDFDINDMDEIIQIADALGNVDLYSQMTEKGELNVHNVVHVLTHKLRNEKSIESKIIDREIEFISENFFDINQCQLMDLNCDILRMIFSMSTFHVESEDDLFDFIYQIISQDPNPETESLLEFVQFEFLTKKYLKKYLSLLDFDSMNSSLWKRICSRLLSIPPRPMIESPRKSKNIIKIEFDHKDQFNGIFQNLNRQCEGNAHLGKVIQITSSGDKLNNCYEIINKNWNSRWFTKNCNFSWWMVDFKEMSVSLTGYSLKTYTEPGTGYPHLQSWIIEGSNDKEHWERIDTQEPNNYLKGSGYSKMFELSRPTMPFRYFRLMSNGPNHEGSYYLLLSSIEFFGTIYL